MAHFNNKIAILGCGNIGSAIANGLISSKFIDSKNLILSDRNQGHLESLKAKGFNTAADNGEALQKADIFIIAVTPQQVNALLDDIKGQLTEKHILLSVVSGASVSKIKEHIGIEIPVVRIMPNTAIAIRESMTCICADRKDADAVDLARTIFDSVGKTVVISENLMGPATALCGCGTAFFLRAIRAASQGGIEIGFHAQDAIAMAAQTAKGAAAILLETDSGSAHPEGEIDKVTTPQGITISGLNQMEHHGFSSSMIRGIVGAAEKAEHIYSNSD